MSRIRWCWSLAPISAALAACGALPPTADGLLVVRTEILCGRLHVEGFEVLPGATAGFDRDLEVDSEGDILILGTLLGLPGDPLGPDTRGADLVLRSRTRIVIAGEVRGAPGRDGSMHPEALALLGEDPTRTRLTAEQARDGLAQLLERRPDSITDVRVLDGGRGGHVILEAPEIFIEKIVGGAAGSGGPGGAGGAGGNLYGNCGFAYRDGSPGSFGGAGGAGGPAVRNFHAGRGGNGGDSGGGIFWPPPIAIR